MIEFGHRIERTCDGVSRREFLQIGAAGFLGLSLPALMASQQAQAAAQRDSEMSVILVFLWGGPGHTDTWDMKPDAPADVRGEFKPIKTNVPGIEICEMLPLLAKQADKYTLIRCATHDQSVHAQAAHYALTGSKLAPGREAPNLGATVTKFLPQRNALPSAIHIGPRMFDTPGNGPIGQDGGFLGNGVAPFRIYDAMQPVDKLAALTPPNGLSPNRLDFRKELLHTVDSFQRHIESSDTKIYDTAYEKAFSLVTSPQAKRAFDLSQEPQKLRERYGMCQFGQGLLMARRLVEAGVRFVQVNWRAHPINDDVDKMGFDNHTENFPRLKRQLLQFDQIVFALIEDVFQRGMDKKTLVLVTGEFGRTTRVNGAGGRDHWPSCYSFILAGAGIPGGRVIGASDATGAYPSEGRVTPEDTMMSVCRLMGMDVSQKLREARIVRDSPGIQGLFGS
ncbi:MAG TPA: DUF1501 domain-containing protein [Chthonomonadaceae bacterium]|nr:DUF1501 domain-containing protein [Chthonomonadaceae bacterium]